VEGAAIDQVEAMLAKHRGHEKALFSKLARKYGVQEEMASEMSGIQETKRSVSQMSGKARAEKVKAIQKSRVREVERNLMRRMLRTQQEVLNRMSRIEGENAHSRDPAAAFEVSEDTQGNEYEGRLGMMAQLVSTQNLLERRAAFMHASLQPGANTAAAQLQAHYRGRQTRRIYRTRRAEAAKIRTAQNTAAVKIQVRVRGVQARRRATSLAQERKRQAAELREHQRHTAAVKIQAQSRGRAGRRRAAQLRADKKSKEAAELMKTAKLMKTSKPQKPDRTNVRHKGGDERQRRGAKRDERESVRRGRMEQGGNSKVRSTAQRTGRTALQDDRNAKRDAQRDKVGRRR